METCITGLELLNHTELGKELKKYLPPETLRVIIDTPIDDPVTITVVSIPHEPIYGLDWSQAIDEIAKISFTEMFIKIIKENEELVQRLKDFETADERSNNRKS